MGWQWHQLDHMQIICTSFETDSRARFLQARCPSCHPTNSIKALKAVLKILTVLYCWRSCLQWPFAVCVCVDTQSACNNEVFISTHALLMTLYDRDCRRSFTPAGHWLVRFVSETLLHEGAYLILICTKSVCRQRTVPCNATLGSGLHG